MSSKTTLIVITTLIIISIIILTVQKTTEKFTEYFGLSCIDYIPFMKTPEYPVKKDRIFISIASYRDSECSETVYTIFSQARYPKNVFLGICEQNSPLHLEELCVLKYKNFIKPYLRQIKYHNINYKDAKGPTYARYFCSKLWSGEEYYLQIDSHSFFEKDWDVHLINQLKACTYSENPETEESYGNSGSKRPVLSTYPPTEEQIKNSNISVIDSGTIAHNGLPSFLASIWTGSFQKPLRSTKPFISGGLFFTYGSFLNIVQYDPYLSHLFQSEEFLFSARMFTNGFDVFVPSINVLSHHYNRKGPMYFKDIKDSTECKKLAETKVKFLLGLTEKLSVADDYLRDYNNYGLGTFRTISDFFNASGITTSENKLVSLEPWTQNGTVSEKFEGWNFYKSGYTLIKKM